MDTSQVIENLLQVPAEDWGDWLLRSELSDRDRARIASALLGLPCTPTAEGRTRRQHTIAMSMLDNPHSDCHARCTTDGARDHAEFPLATRTHGVLITAAGPVWEEQYFFRTRSD